MSKPQSVGVSHNLGEKEGNRNIQIGRPQTFLSTKGVSTVDEFKYGFPSEGLSISSNKWWGSRASTSPDAASSSSSVTMEETALLMSARKKIVEEGREALKLGVIRRYGTKLQRKERALLRTIFKSSLPEQWINGSS